MNQINNLVIERLRLLPTPLGHSFTGWAPATPATGTTPSSTG
eukprot:CAMPEP_0204287870 /NCGR_PEP_ID=MMETSP0468-20130131/55572_1 /ASSEMBLY_ACC=CAM_ASM_000383 /TAXON_ID=2969 /ORGANISM="Oxyrrhis marina" /LENGTH=41 /DNA_ID= /DNA_START= /DNA_END= /DNA_ORIENTATION=